jgi:Flp pilus assembly protein TadG
MSTHRRRRRNQHGQVLIITALMATLLIGTAALAVDLSVQTGNRRTLQNVTDVAALAGARDLYASGATLGASDQANAISDALLTVQRDMQWPDNWATNATACSGFPPAAFATYRLSGQCTQVPYGNYTVTVSTPPMSPRDLADMDPHDVQVDMTQSSPNGLAGIIGFTSSQQGGHAVASHMPAGTTMDFALFSNTYANAGNYNEVVHGNVYANRAVVPQSSGLSTFCVVNTTGNDDGYIILASPQTFASGGQASINHAPTIGTASTCDSPPPVPVAQVNAGTRQPSPVCPVVTGLADALSYDSTVGTCVTLPIAAPAAVPPPLSGTVVQISQPCKGGGGGGGKKGMTSCWSSTTTVAPGLYVVNHNSNCVPTSCWDLLITSSMTLSNITFWLKPGATMGVNMGGSGGTVTDSGPYNAGTGQAGDARYVVFGEGASDLEIVGANNSVTFNQGSIYMPGGTVVGKSSTANLTLNGGQAVTNNWQIGTGAQFNPVIHHNPAFDAVSQETLRLVE